VRIGFLEVGHAQKYVARHRAERIQRESRGQVGLQHFDRDLAVVLEIVARYTVAIPPAPSSRSNR
jgi:hypothetical protein